MCSPGLITSRHSPVFGVVEEVAIFTQAPPQAKLLARIIALVDEVTLVGIGTVTLGESFAGSVPSLGLEAVVVLEAQVHALTQRAKEGRLVGGRPAESWPLAVGGSVVTAGAGTGVASALDRFRGAVVVVGHGVDVGMVRGLGGNKSVRSSGPTACSGFSRGGAFGCDAA